MKKIGEGYYYKVYDLGNGRVSKKLKKGFDLFFHILKVNNYTLWAFSEYRTVLRNLPRIETLYREIIRRLVDPSLIGNPTFDEGIDYQQDKGVLLGYAIKQGSMEQFEKYIEAYIVLIKKLWEVGCHEKVYNFTINNALNNKGEVILIDFNEVTFDKECVAESIAENRWLKRYSYISLPFDKKKYFKKRMAEEITVEELNRLWK